MGMNASRYANRLFERSVRGAIGGFIATLPMTVLMELGYRVFLDEERRSLPPREITSELARRARIDRHLNEQGHFGLALGGHFTYGALAGLPAVILTRWLKGPEVVRGMLYGCALWAASYFGLIPALHVGAAGTEQSVRSNLLMATAHLLWGASLAATAAALDYERPVAVRGLGRARPPR